MTATRKSGMAALGMGAALGLWLALGAGIALAVDVTENFIGSGNNNLDGGTVNEAPAQLTQSSNLWWGGYAAGGVAGVIQRNGTNSCLIFQNAINVTGTYAFCIFGTTCNVQAIALTSQAVTTGTAQQIRYLVRNSVTLDWWASEPINVRQFDPYLTPVTSVQWAPVTVGSAEINEGPPLDAGGEQPLGGFGALGTWAATGITSIDRGGIYIVAGGAADWWCSGIQWIESWAQPLSITAEATSYTIDFNSYRGGGFGPGTGTCAVSAGLNSGMWSAAGFSFHNATQFDFGQPGFAKSHKKGVTNVAVTLAGFYAYDFSGGNYGFLIQPTGADFTPGTLTLKIKNNTAATLQELVFSYDIYVRNDMANSYALTFSHSADNVTYTPVASMDYATPAALDALGMVFAGSRSAVLSGLNLAPGAVYYLRFNGAGAEAENDEIVLDNISISGLVPVTLSGFQIE